MSDPPVNRFGPLQQYGDAWLAAIIESSDDAIVSKTLDGVITSWNAAAERIFGYSAAEAVGQHISLIIPLDRRAEEDHVLATIRRGERLEHFETIRQRKDGHLIDVSLTVSPVRDADGRVVGASKVARDISLRRVAYALEQRARAAAEAANRDKDEFLATLSHELRTPLNAVYGWARILEENTVDALTMAKAIAAIRRNAVSQIHLVDDLLDVSRVIAGKLQIQPGPVDFASVVEAAVEAMRPAAAEKGVTIHFAVGSGMGLMLGDPQRLQQVAGNLLGNAIKFTPPTGNIFVDLRPVNAQVVLTIRDTGEGIAESALPFIFDRFRQGDSGSTRRHGGLGIGLSLVRHLVGLHGGTVDAASAGPGAGSVFTVRLPIAFGPSVGEMREKTGGAAPSSTVLDGLDLLLVDDDADGLELARSILVGCGANVHAYPSGVSALNALATGQWPHALIADIEMPGMNGVTLLHQARALAREGRHPLPAIALTAHGTLEDRHRLLAAGFDQHLAKPLEPTGLCAAVALLTGRSV